jgi:RHS repeat-associated protein
MIASSLASPTCSWRTGCPHECLKHALPVGSSRAYAACGRPQAPSGEAVVMGLVAFGHRIGNDCGGALGRTDEPVLQGIAMRCPTRTLAPADPQCRSTLGLPAFWPRVPSSPRSRLGNPFAHQGLPLDAEIASYQNRARQYNPGLNRFMQRDPLITRPQAGSGYQDGASLYVYVRSNPAKATDPLGTKTCSGWAPTGSSSPKATSAIRLTGGGVQCIWGTCRTRTRTCMPWYVKPCYTETLELCNTPVPFITTVLPAPAPFPAGPGPGVNIVVYCNNWAPGPVGGVIPVAGGAPPAGLPPEPPATAWPP